MNSPIGASGCAPKRKAIVATKYMATVDCMRVTRTLRGDDYSLA